MNGFSCARHGCLLVALEQSHYCFIHQPQPAPLRRAGDPHPWRPRIAVVLVALALGGIAVNTSDQLQPTAPKPAPMRTVSLDCPAPAEPEILIITVKHRDGRIVSDCLTVRGSDRAYRRPPSASAGASR